LRSHASGVPKDFLWDTLLQPTRAGEVVGAGSAPPFGNAANAMCKVALRTRSFFAPSAWVRYPAWIPTSTFG